MSKKRHFETLSAAKRTNSTLLHPVAFNTPTNDGEDVARDRNPLQRIVVSVPKSCGNAVKRNRMKRIFKHALADSLDSLPQGRGLWIRVKRQHKLSSNIQLSQYRESLVLAQEVLSKLSQR